MISQSQLDALDLQRLGLLLLAAADMSRDRYVLTRYSTRHGAWKVSVRFYHPQPCACQGPLPCLGTVEHVTQSQESLLLAMDRAVQWLRGARAQLEAARIPA